MPAGDAYFGFDTNAEVVAARIEGAMRDVAESIAQASRGVGGTVPFNFADQIVANAREGVERARVEMDQLFGRLTSQGGLADVRGQAGGIRGYARDSLAQVGTNMFNNIRLSLDESLRQLDPSARLELLESGRLNEILNQSRGMVFSQLEDDFMRMRNQLDANVRRGMPRAPDLTRAQEEVDQIRGQIWQAEAERMSQIYQVMRDEEGNMLARGGGVADIRGGVLPEFERDPLGRPVPVGEAREVDAQRRAQRERLRSEEAAARRAAEEQARADRERAMAESRRLLADPEFSRIGRTQFYQRGATGEPGVGEYYRLGQRGGAEIFERIDDNLEREVSATRAREARLQELAVATGGTDAEARRAMRDQQRRAGFIGGVGQGLFGRGFGSEVFGEGIDRKAALTNIGQTAGSAMRYSVAYGGLYGIAQAARAALDEFSDFQDSLTDYEVAVGPAVGSTDSLTGSMMELTRVLGENVGAAYDAAARGVRAFSDAQDSANDKAETGLSIATASQQLAVITGKTQTDATGDVISIGTSFGLSAAQAQTVIPDAIANAKKLGGDPAQIAQGLSNFATTAEEAGFNIQEAANVISLVQARTDQSGQAVATRLSRMFSILGGTTGRGLIETVNRAFGGQEMVDPSASAKDQLQDLARAYVKAGEQGRTSLQGLIRSQLGGTSNVRELIPLLEEQPRLAQALEESLPGAGATEYERKISKFINQIDQIRGSIKNLVILAAEADLAAPFAALVAVIEPSLHMIERLLKLYNNFKDATFGKVPGLSPVMTTGLLGYGGYRAFRAFRDSQMLGEIAGTQGVTGAVTRATGVTPRNVGLAADTTAMGAHTAATVADTAAEGRKAVVVTGAQASMARLAVSSNAAAAAVGRLGFSAATGLANLGSGARTAAGVAAAAGLLVWADKAMEDYAKVNRLSGDRARLLAGMGGTAEELGNTENALRANAANASKGLSWASHFPTIVSPSLWSSIASGVDEDPLRTAAGNAAIEGERAAVAARATGAIRDQVAAEERRIAALRKTSIFGDQASRTAESLATAFENLALAGVPPQGMFRRFRRAWNQEPQPAITSADRPVGLGAEAGSAMLEQLRRELGERGTRLANPLSAKSWSWETDPWVSGGELFSELELEDQIPRFNQAITRRLRKAAEDGKVTRDELNAALTAGADSLDLSDLEAYSEDVAGIKKQIVRDATRNINLVNSRGDLRMPAPSAAEMDAMVQQMDQHLAAAFPDTGIFGQYRRSRENFEAIRRRRNLIHPDFRRQAAQDIPDLPAAANLIPGAQLAQFAAGRERTGDRLDLKRIDREFRVRQHEFVQYAVQRETMLREAEESAYDPSLKRNWGRLTRIRRRGALREFDVAGGDIEQLIQIMNGLDRETIMWVRRHSRRLQNNQQLMRRFDRALRFATPSLKSPWEEQKQQEKEEGMTPAQIAALAELAKIDPDDEVALAANAIRTARADIAAALRKGGKDEEYWNAVKSLTEAQDAYGKAVAARAASALKANIDPDDSVAMADAELRGAILALNEIKPGTDAYNQQLASVNALRDAKEKAVAARAASALKVDVDPDDARAMAQAELEGAILVLNAIKPGTDAYNQQLASVNELRDAAQDAAVSEANAFRTAAAARGGGEIAAAKAAVDGARAAMAVTAQGTEEYANLLQQLYQGQHQLTEAVLNYKATLDQLEGDITDPVENARDAVRDAVRRLRAHQRAGMDPEIIAQDRLNVRQREAERERAAFDQRMSDAQTANELGRMSFQAYMNYLNREHDRLSAIKNRTRQQQDMLNQVDMAIKEAATQMDSQFNLGDIDVNGLVYQTRRFMAEQRRNNLRERAERGERVRDSFGSRRRDVQGGRPGGARFNQDVRIQIDGADVAQVRRVLSDILGPNAHMTRAVMNRKVG